MGPSRCQPIRKKRNGWVRWCWQARGDVEPFSIATPVPVPLPVPRQSFFVRKRFPRPHSSCQVPGPIFPPALPAGDFPVRPHRLRNTPENTSSRPTSLVPFFSPFPLTYVLALRRCCHPQEQPQNGARCLSKLPLFIVCPRERKKKLGIC